MELAVAVAVAAWVRNKMQPAAVAELVVILWKS
jgi:hypothetical protein